MLWKLIIRNGLPVVNKVFSKELPISIKNFCGLALPDIGKLLLGR